MPYSRKRRGRSVSRSRRVRKTVRHSGASYLAGLSGYAVKTNSLMGKNSSIRHGADGSIEITHREFIGDVLTQTVAGPFNNTAYNINPGLATTFPFLSKLASNFEQYHFKGLVFEFITTSGTAVGATNTALGTVVLATEYDANNALFATKQQMEAYEFCCSTVPSASVAHPIECSVGSSTLKNSYVRTGPLPTNTTATSQDLRFYDMGIFQIATSGQQNNAAAINLGELWVSYNVVLLKPNLTYASGLAFKGRNSTGVTAAAPLGTAANFLYPVGSTMSLGVLTSTTFQLLYAGTFLVTIGHNATAGVITNGAYVTFGSNITAPMSFNAAATAYDGDFTTTGSTYETILVVSASGSTTANSVTVVGATGMTAGNVDLMVVQLPAALVLN